MCQVCHQVNWKRIKCNHLSNTLSTMHPMQRDEDSNAFRLLLIKRFEFLFERYKILMEAVHYKMFIEAYNFDGINCIFFLMLIFARVKGKVLVVLVAGQIGKGATRTLWSTHVNGV